MGGSTGKILGGAMFPLTLGTASLGGMSGGGSGKGGGQQNTTETTTNTPWGPTGEKLGSLYYYMDPWLTGNTNNKAYNKVSAAAQNRIAPIDPNVQQAWEQQIALAKDPNSAYGVSANEALKTARGDYLNSNPYLDRNVNTALDQVQSRVNSQFGLAGRTGSGMNQDVMTRGMGDIASQMYGNNYQAERGRQMQALGLAPYLSGLSADTLGNVGNQQMAYNQQRLNAPYSALQQYASLIQPGLGFGSQTQTVPYHNNQGAMLGMLGGAGLGALMGGGLPGATLGANLGGAAGSYFL